MTADRDLSLARHLAELPDPRIDRTRKHSLGDILIIAPCATIAGADSWEEVQRFGEAKVDRLRGFLWTSPPMAGAELRAKLEPRSPPCRRPEGRSRPEFKAEAVKLATEQGRSFVEVARDLDIGESTLRSWRQAIAKGGVQAFPGRGNPPVLEEELRRHRAEVKRLTMERDVLKEATASAPRSSGEEESSTRNLSSEPCGSPIPPGRAGPATGSESCVVGGRPPLRSVDDEIKRRAIEPRNAFCRVEHSP